MSDESEEAAKTRIFKPKVVLLGFNGTIAPMNWENQLIAPYITENLHKFLEDNWNNETVTAAFKKLKEESFQQHHVFQNTDCPVITEKTDTRKSLDNADVMLKKSDEKLNVDDNSDNKSNDKLVNKKPDDKKTTDDKSDNKNDKQTEDKKSKDNKTNDKIKSDNESADEKSDDKSEEKKSEKKNSDDKNSDDKKSEEKKANDKQSGEKSEEKKSDDNKDRGNKEDKPDDKNKNKRDSKEEETEEMSDIKQLNEFIIWQINNKKETADSQKIIQLVLDDALSKKKIQVPLFADVLPALKKLKQLKLKIVIFSSVESEMCRKLLSNTSDGDITSYLSEYYDEKNGNSKDKQSYIKIAQNLNVDTKDILYVVDYGQSAKSCKQAGGQSLLIARPNNRRIRKHYLIKINKIDSLSEIEFVDRKFETSDLKKSSDKMSDDEKSDDKSDSKKSEEEKSDDKKSDDKSDSKKSEEKKSDDKKSDDKSDSKKSEEKKSDDKKSDDKSDSKKSEEKKSDDKKSDDKLDDKKVDKKQDKTKTEEKKSDEKSS